ncbi:MAG: sulfatase-like hydrolase/transferase [Opitutales bacterium]|jgi:arylsulfatase A-like enzyme|nr:sulfatase-like hydrolase/transferase [Opitutales bacterium]MBT5170560.1 sulfatase-like hydrolase/transferase [Opitutales bacterium]MBT5813305.1 sulfatase-like hydrolase/transferase [Opitutales bacterium]MDG2255303.1 sulfatase-like hydrolase/transferase [Opitutaceae bacterium]
MSTPNRRNFLKTATTGAIAAGLSPTFSLAQENSGRKPNVVMIFIDDLGFGDIACFGNSRIPTPHIDSLATRGAKCTMSYITNPPCSPSRCSLMTGMYAQRYGKSGMARGLPIPEDHPTMGEFMRDAGYVTGQVGKWDIGSNKQGPSNRGFMEVAKRAPADQYEATLEDGGIAYLTDLDGDYMAEFVDRNADKPFFLYFSPNAVHSKVKDTPQHYRDRVPAEDGTAYEGAVIAVDDQVGKMLAMLEKHGLEEDTLIIFSSDNGANIPEGGLSEPYRGGKGKDTQQEGWVHTPSILSWPGTIPEGITYDGKMATIDFYTTMAAAIGKTAPKRCDGNNLLPYFSREKKGDAHEYLYWHNADPTDAPRRNLYAVRWKDWRMVKYPDGWCLFDLKKDPKELKDRASQYPEVIDQLRKRYDAFVSTLPPLKPSADYKGGGQVPKGWGWEIGKG